jgi:arylsulfatase A-like enzyme
MLPKLGASYLRLPNIDRLSAEGVTFRNHFTQSVPCGPARASMLTGLYQMNHRAVQNTIPLDSRFTNLAHELRRGGYDPALVGYTTTTPDPRKAAPNDPRFFVLGDIMEGFHSVGAFENRDAYFGWVANQGFKLPANRDDVWQPQGAPDRGEKPGATGRPAVIPKELSDTAWFTERGLAYLQGIGARAASDGGYGRKPWFLHLGYYRPHPPFIAPAPYNAMYRPEDMPKVVRAASPAAEAKQNALLAYYVNNVKQASFFQDGQGLGSDMTEAQVAQMRATCCGLMSEIDDHLGRVFDYLKQTGQWDDTLIVFTCDHGEQWGDHHLLGKIGYFDESYRIPMIVRDPRARRTARAARWSRASPRRSTPCRPSSTGSACRCRASATASRCCRSAKAGPRPAGAPRRTTSSISATSITARPNRRSACRWTSAASRWSGRALQVRPLRRPAAAVLRLDRRRRPVREPCRRSGLCRADGRVCAEMLNWRLGSRSAP